MSSADAAVAAVAEFIPVAAIRRETLSPSEPAVTRRVVPDPDGLPNFSFVLRARPERIDRIERLAVRALKFFATEVVGADPRVARRLDTMHLFLLLAPSPRFDKRLPSESTRAALSADNVNSGVTVRETAKTTVIVYREDEWVKVLFHELVHAAQLEFSGGGGSEKEAVLLLRDWAAGRDDDDAVAAAVRAASDDHLVECINESFTECAASRLHERFAEVCASSAHSRHRCRFRPRTSPRRLVAHAEATAAAGTTCLLGYVFLKDMYLQRVGPAAGDGPAAGAAGAEDDDDAFRMDCVWENEDTGEKF